MEDKFGQSQVIDLPRLVASCKDKWSNFVISEVNDSVLRLGVIEGEFHWHQHQREDEFFLVISGKLLLDLEDGTMELSPQQGYTVPRGVVHRTRAPERTVVLMVEQATVNPKGD
jgi:mannose-6-phosphate isomerase-like protein (cupin superfamily)